MSTDKRGFASMSPEQQRALAGAGGRAAHAAGTAHTYTPEEAALAGKLGGIAVSQDREHMSHIGRRGGLSRKATDVAKDAAGIARPAV
jgi:general stress protein YciG